MNYHYPQTVTVHLYQCSSLHEGMNVQTILNARLPEYGKYTADTSEELDRKWEDYAARPGTCAIVESEDGVICGGIGGPSDYKIWLSQYFDDKAKTKKGAHETSI